MWADLINKEKIHRVLWCALYMAVTVALQTTVFAHIALFGVHAMFVPAVVVAVGMFEGGTWGAVFGLVTGYFCAMGYPETGLLFGEETSLSRATSGWASARGCSRHTSSITGSSRFS